MKASGQNTFTEQKPVRNRRKQSRIKALKRKKQSSSLSGGFYPFGGWGPTGQEITIEINKLNTKQNVIGKQEKKTPQRQSKSSTATVLNAGN
jgi:hypothetical protein